MANIESEKMLNRAAELHNCLKEIRAYAQLYPELQAAHHFMFDLRHCAIDKVRYVLMGQNPGERLTDFAICDRGEETSESDFRSSEKAIEIGRPSRSEMKWSVYGHSVFGGWDFVQTERFFWSSRNLKLEFVSRFGKKLPYSPHLNFCAAMNKRLIAAYDPAAIVCPGISGMRATVRNFGLSLSKTTTSKTGKRLVIHYVDDKRRPWLFAPNPTGAWGIGKEEKETITSVMKDVVRAA